MLSTIKGKRLPIDCDDLDIFGKSKKLPDGLLGDLRNVDIGQAIKYEVKLTKEPHHISVCIDDLVAMMINRIISDQTSPNQNERIWLHC